MVVNNSQDIWVIINYNIKRGKIFEDIWVIVVYVFFKN